MRNTTLPMFLLFLAAANGLLVISNAWAVQPTCNADKPNQYAPQCICPEETRDLAITGRLPTGLADDSGVSVYPEGGAQYAICLPPVWNNKMVYASMGTVRLDPNEKEGTIATVAGQLILDGTPLAGLFNQLGYGFAVVAPPQLLSVPSREADLQELVEVVENALGQPSTSYVVGLSQGAIPATRLLEKGNDSPFDGGIAACGPIGSFGSVPGQIQPDEPPLYFSQVEYSLQFLVIADYLFPELNLLRDIPPPFVQVPQVPASTLVTWDDDAVEAIFGDASNASRVSRLLESMLQLGLPVAVDSTGQVPVKQTLAELLKEIAFFVNDAISDFGGNIFDNWTTDYYFDSDLNSGVRRYRATLSPDEIDNVLGPYETQGLQAGDPPLVTLHNVYDHRVPFAHELLYGQKSDPGAPYIPLPIPTYGHCQFTPSEAVLAFGCLVGVVEDGAPASSVCSVPSEP